MRGVPQTLTPQEFDRAALDGWRVLGRGPSACFRTGSLTVGVQLVDAVAALADAAGRSPEVDLRQAVVVVRLPLAGVPRIEAVDVELARQISAAARELDVPADPAAVQHVDLTIDALERAAVLPFWRAVLGYDRAGEDDLLDPHGASPSIWFQPMDAPRAGRNRVHVDVWVPQDQAPARVAAALANGGHLVSDANAPAWWTLADSEGNEVDVATWASRPV